MGLKLWAASAAAAALMVPVGALPFPKDGPVASADSFAEADKAFGAQWLSYAFWFN